MRMQSRMRPITETIEAGLLPELLAQSFLPWSQGNTLYPAVNHLEV